MRVVVDTSVSFSALAFGGKPREVLNSLLADDDVELVYSARMREELYRTLTKKGKNSPGVIHEVNRYFALATRNEAALEVSICRDPDDDFILECAMSARASLIISSDEDLLVLTERPEIGAIEVISVVEAYTRFVQGNAQTGRPT